MGGDVKLRVLCWQEWHELVGVEEVRWHVSGSDLHVFILKAINQGKMLLLDLYLQSIKSQNLMQVIINENRHIEVSINKSTEYWG